MLIKTAIKLILLVLFLYIYISIVVNQMKNLIGGEIMNNCAISDKKEYINESYPTIHLNELLVITI